jgi:hypothetical protein
VKLEREREREIVDFDFDFEIKLYTDAYFCFFVFLLFVIPVVLNRFCEVDRGRELFSGSV